MGRRGGPDAVFGVKHPHLGAALGEMARRYGTIERYFADGLGIDAVAQNSLRELYLGDPASGVPTEAASR